MKNKFYINNILFLKKTCGEGTDLGLAEFLGVSRSTIIKWKNGVIPEGSNCLKIKTKCGFSIDDLLTRDISQPQKEMAPETVVSEAINKLGSKEREVLGYTKDPDFWGYVELYKKSKGITDTPRKLRLTDFPQQEQIICRHAEERGLVNFFDKMVDYLTQINPDPLSISPQDRATLLKIYYDFLLKEQAATAPGQTKKPA